MDILPRELAARYQVLELMGQGGMGAVYKVRHNELDRVCVIKVMLAQLQDNKVLRDRFLSEAKKGAQISHPNIAAVLDFFVGSNGTACLVMEYIDGKSVVNALRENPGPFDYRTAAGIVSQALSAVACLHSKKLVHRDISPDNMMLTRDFSGNQLVKLIDLGIAKSLEEPGSVGTGFFIGKWSYAPPEQFGNQVDERSDIYAMGVVLYQLLTKQLPIVANDFASYYAAHLKNEAPRPFSETDPQNRVPESVRRVVLQALAKKPEERFHSADAFRAALQSAVAPQDATVPEPQPPARTVPTPVAPKPPVARTSTAFLAIALTLFALIGVFVYEMLSRQQRVPLPPPPGTDTTRTISNPSHPPDKKRAAAEITTGTRLARAADFAGAYAAFMRATEADPANAYAWSNLGGAAAKIGKTAEAIEACRKSLALDPDNWLAHYNLACQLVRQGQRDPAIEHVMQAVTQLRRAARSRDELDAYLANIRTDDALKELRNDPRFNALVADN